MARQQRSAHIEPPLVKIPGEICQRLRCVAETVEEKHPHRIAGAQVDWTRALNYVCYRNRSERGLLRVGTLRASRLPGNGKRRLFIELRCMKAGCQLLGINNKARPRPRRHPTAHHPAQRQGDGFPGCPYHLAKQSMVGRVEAERGIVHHKPGILAQTHEDRSEPILHIQRCELLKACEQHASLRHDLTNQRDRVGWLLPEQGSELLCPQMQGLDPIGGLGIGDVHAARGEPLGTEGLPGHCHSTDKASPALHGTSEYHVPMQHYEDPVGGRTTTVHLKAARPVCFCAKLGRRDSLAER